MTVQELQGILFQYRDSAYADFSARLIPTVPREKFIGVRSPEFKKIARQIRDDPVVPVFLSSLPHTYHEENIWSSCFQGCWLRCFNGTGSVTDLI